ncbi:MAG: EH signature domain-containing protein [Candidatus Binatia bacterium]
MQIEANSAERDLDLVEAVKALRMTLRDTQIAARQPLFSDHDLDRLRATVSSVGQERAARAPVCPDARQQWSDFVAGKRKDIEARAVRFLCWEPDVATDRRFQQYLDRSTSELRARALQGLVRSCHARWSAELFSKLGVGNAVRRRVSDYDGANRVVRKWRSASDLILGSSGPEDLGTDMVENRRPIGAECELWTLEERSPFVLRAAKHAAQRCRDQIGPQSAANQFLLRELLRWPDWPSAEFKDQVCETILHPATTQVPEVVDGLKRLVFQHEYLGDPRLPANETKWRGLPKAALERFVQWLSQDDIEFFFEHVLPRGSDPHGRKAFWLRYVKRVKMSRPLLNWRDQTRLQARMSQLRGQVGNYGRIAGLADTSAFLLDFGRVVVVEFSRVGNACYVYQKSAANQLIPDFWSAEPFDVSGRNGLKQPTLAAERLRHVVGWQDELAMILARHGVRPVSRDDP